MSCATLVCMSDSLSSEFFSPYNHTEKEPALYKKWEESGYFNPDNLPVKGEPYTIIMPPPNANGALHAGLALFITLEDLMICLLYTSPSPRD